VLSTVGGIAGVALAGCAEGPGDDNEGQDTNNGTETTTAENVTDIGNETDGTDATDISGEVGDNIPEQIEVVRHDIFESGNQVGVTETLKNTGEQAFNEVEVEVTLRDGDTIIGEFIDTNEEETESLAAGGVWQFVVFFEDESLNQSTGYTIEIDGELA